MARAFERLWKKAWYSPKSPLPEFWCPADLQVILANKFEPDNGDISDESQQFIDVLYWLMKVERLDLAQSHYLELMKLSLFLEEHQHYVEYQKYNMYGKSIEMTCRHRKLFKIIIEDFDKDHPLHTGCKLVELVDVVDETKTKCCFRVKEIKNDHVIVVGYPAFCQSYHEKMVFNVKFRWNNYTARCAHHAIMLIDFYKMTPQMFPTKIQNTHFKQILLVDRDTWFNKQIAENPEQKQAVLNILSKSSFPAPYILYGPPGTGKTATLVEAICQIYETTTENILVCAPSNSAADVITKRLLNHLPSIKIGRIFGRSRDANLIDSDVKICSNWNCCSGILPVRHQFVNAKRVIICTLCTCTKLLFQQLSIQFNYLFIDEAGQATEPDSLIAFATTNLHGGSRCQIVISGDPQQLGPSIRSKFAVPVLGQSILERLMKRDLYEKNENNNYDSRYITKLLRNYRSHPAIISVSNELYYDNELISCTNNRQFDNKDFPTFRQNFPIVFHAVSGDEAKETKSTSPYNEAEARQVLIYVRELLGKTIAGKVIDMEDIGIVTPFSSQSNHLQKCLKEQNLDKVMVGTVEIFQGQEKKVIIISTVRSKIFYHKRRAHIGFLSNPRRFNVALTRAKDILIVIGNPKVLQVDRNWRSFLKYCKDNEACQGESFFMKFWWADDAQDNKTCRVSTDLFEKSLNLLRIADGRLRMKL